MLPLESQCACFAWNSQCLGELTVPWMKKLLCVIDGSACNEFRSKPAVDAETLGAAVQDRALTATA